MTNECGRSLRGRGGVRLRYALATIAGTALACSLAAVLALILVGPRYEARITLSVPSPAGDALIEAARQSEEGFRTSRAGTPLSFPFALYAGLRSQSANGRTGIGGANAIGRTVLLPEAGGVVVVATGTNAGEANDLVAASGRALLARWRTLVEGENVAVADAAPIERSETILAELRFRLAALPEVSPRSDLRRALQQAVEESAAAEGELADIRERISRLREVLRAPGGSGNAGIDQVLDERVEAYRALREASVPLQSLPPDNPRRRTATTRLEQLLHGIREHGGRLLEQWSRDEAVSERRRGIVARAEDHMRTVLGEATRIAAQRRALDRVIERSEEELANLRAAASEQPARLPTVRSSETLRELPPPYIAAAMFAAFAGSAVAVLSVGILRLARRRLSPAFTDPLDGSEQAEERRFS